MSRERGCVERAVERSCRDRERGRFVRDVDERERDRKMCVCVCVCVCAVFGEKLS